MITAPRKSYLKMRLFRLRLLPAFEPGGAGSFTRTAGFMFAARHPLLESFSCGNMVFPGPEVLFRDNSHSPVQKSPFIQ